MRHRIRASNVGSMRAGEVRPAPSQFRELAQYYDVLNAGKDYRGESARVESIARRFVGPGRKTWLDVGCGTGRHLEWLKRHHSTMGVDASPQMLRIARRRLPDVPLIAGDMRSFRLDRRFDVISCLYSAIGHLQTKADVRRALSTFEQHLRPGGLAIVEPWIERSEFHPGFLHLSTHRDLAITAVRVAYSRVRRNHSIVEYHYLIGHPGRGVRYLKVSDVGLLLAQRELTQLMREAGLTPRFISQGLTPGRGLLLGIKT